MQTIEVKPKTKARDIILADCTSRKALVVYDELINREVATVYLKRCGFLVDEGFWWFRLSKTVKS